MKQCKEAAKRSDVASAKVLARELVHTRKTISQLYVNKAHMIAMNAQLTEQLGVVKVAGTLSRSTQVGYRNIYIFTKPPAIVRSQPSCSPSAEPRVREQKGP